MSKWKLQASLRTTYALWSSLGGSLGILGTIWGPFGPLWNSLWKLFTLLWDHLGSLGSSSGSLGTGWEATFGFLGSFQGDFLMKLQIA